LSGDQRASGARISWGDWGKSGGRGIKVAPDCDWDSLAVADTRK